MLKFLSAIEAKVWAAAGGGSILSGFLLWLIGYLAFGGSIDASMAEATAQAVPAPVALFVIALSAAVAGYSAPHTVRSTDTPTSVAQTDPDGQSAADTLAAAAAIYPSSTEPTNTVGTSS